MLNKVQLLVTRRDREVISVRSLVCAPRAEWWVGENHVHPAHPFGRVIDCVAQADLWFELVEVKVHQGQPARGWVDVLTKVGLLTDTTHFTALQLRPAFGLLDEPLIGGD